ncbi:MAG: sugar transferase, partial [Lentisphaeria bacterium]|nr:sugar transferase [Lentisphaeria bacterium]
MTLYEEIQALRQELKRPSVFRHNHIQMRMVLWHLTIRSSVVFKRFMDIVLSIIAVIIGSPVFLITAFLVKVTSPGPIIFSQVRVGRYGRHFKFYKFRSMYIDAEARKAELLKHNESGDGVIFKMKHDPRITPVGRFIRKFSIDELPQLFNVLLGDMSLVGPRPPVPMEVRSYTLEERKRLNIT